MKYDTDGTVFAVCPHCGWEDLDCGEWDGGLDIANEPQTCSKCGGKFSYSRHIVVTYSTEIRERQEEARP